MATKIQLNVESRTETGKGVARKLRAAARIPGVVYGRGSDPVPVVLDERSFLRAVSGQSVSTLILDVIVDGGGTVVKSLIREIQTDPVSGKVLHVDLNRISMTELLDVEVPVELEGTPIGVKLGGTLSHPQRMLQVRCLATDIPEVIHLDVSGLNIGDSLHVSDLNLENVEIANDPSTTLAAVAAPRAIEEPTEGEEGDTPAEPELVGGKKPEEGDEKKD